MLAAVAGDVALRLRSASAAKAKPATLRRVTFAPGLEDEPAFSPDGKFLAYTTDERGNLDVLVQPLSGGQAIRIAETDADEGEPAWSPDGSRLAFVSARDHGGRFGVALNVSALEPYLNAKFGDIYLAPALGGAAVKLVEDGYYPSWSPDGKRIVFMSNREGRIGLWTVLADGGAPVPLTRDDSINYQPAWSPDGKWVAYGSGTPGNFVLKAVASSGGTPVVLAEDYGFVSRPTWSADGKDVLFSGERNGVLNVWKLAWDGSRPEPPSRVTLGQGQDTSVSASRDGRKLAFAAVRNDPNIWELDVESGRLRAVTSGTNRADYPQLSPDGKTLLVQSNRTGDLAVWTTDLEGRFLSQLTAGQSTEPQAHWSPDGRQISFVRQGRVWILPIGSMGAQTTAVTDGGAMDWSSDGKFIAVGSRAADGPVGDVVVLDAVTGKLRRVTSLKKDIDYPTWSPDGRRIAFQLQRGAIREIWVVPAEGGEPRPLTKDLEDSHPAWSPTNPDEILFLRDHKRLAVVSVSTGKVKFLPSYSEGSYILDYPSWSRDGKRVYFSVSRKTGDIYILEGL